jgi:hypothetical protein
MAGDSLADNDIADLLKHLLERGFVMIFGENLQIILFWR